MDLLTFLQPSRLAFGFWWFHDVRSYVFVQINAIHLFWDSILAQLFTYLLIWPFRGKPTSHP